MTQLPAYFTSSKSANTILEIFGMDISRSNIVFFNGVVFLVFALVYGPVFYYYSLSITNLDQYQLSIPTAGNLALAWILFFMLFTTIPTIIIRAILQIQVNKEISSGTALNSSKDQYLQIRITLASQLVNIILYGIATALKTKTRILGSDRNYYAMEVFQSLLILIHNILLYQFERIYRSLNQSVLKPYRIDETTYYEDLTSKSDKIASKNTKLEIGGQDYNSVLHNQQNPKESQKKVVDFGDLLQDKLNKIADDSDTRFNLEFKSNISDLDSINTQARGGLLNPEAASDNNQFKDLLAMKLQALCNSSTENADTITQIENTSANQHTNASKLRNKPNSAVYSVN
ncbi:hypothetical protein HDV01_001230 [Terramyces sp. JEL0728]|nr:hypothetical protein HDV01_001230 [Terramyces sp. JEL0728]